MRRAPAKPPAQPVGMAESKRKRTSWQKPEILLNVESVSLTSPGPDDAKPSRADFARLGGSATAG